LLSISFGSSGALAAGYDLAKATRAEIDSEWAFTSMNWSFIGGALLSADSTRSHAVLQRELDGDDAWVEAELVVKDKTGNGWKVAGVSLYQDVRNYWHLALVEAPGDAGGARFVELKLMKWGRWGAEGTESSKYASRAKLSDGSWRFGQKYRLRIEKHGTSIRGRVWGKKGKPIAEIEFEHVSDGFARIYPSVVNGGFNTSFLKLKHSKTRSRTFAGKTTKRKGSGFYSITSDSGIDWLSAPKGGKSLSLGCEWVKYREIWCQALGYSPYHRNSERLFGSEAAWAEDVAAKLRNWNFNTVGQSDRREEIASQGLAYAPILRIGQRFSDIAAIIPKTYWTGFPDVFDERFPRFCGMIAETECRPWRDDPDLLGYYIDNELEWFGKDGKPWALFTGAMKLGPESPAKRAAVEFLHVRYQSLQGFNRSWGCAVESWDKLEDPLPLPDPETQEAIADAEGFVGLCAERYFAMTTSAIRRADPNHLVLGSRFAWVAPEPAWREAGRRCDVVSFNCYPRIDILSGEVPGLKDTLASRHAVCGRPLLVSEWGFPALDAGLPSSRGAGMRVDDQDQRAYCAARLQEELLGIPYMVGTSWFMWADEPALGVTDSFPENSNYGLVDVRHRPYPRLTSALGSVNEHADEVHRGTVKPWFSGMLRSALFRKHGTATRTERPAVRMRQGRLEVDNRDVRLVLTPGKSAGADSILWHGIPMGSYHPLVFQRRGGDGWLAPHRITGFTIDDFPGNGRALDFTAEYVPMDTAWAGFSVKFRLVMPPAGSWILAEVLEISSLDPRPWTLEGYYHYIPSGIKGGPKGDKPCTASVPNYWLSYGGWFDENAGLHFGALALGDNGWVFQPYIDGLGNQHPDIFMSLRRQMNQGESFSVDDGPVVIYMGREDRANPPWTAAAFQAGQWLREQTGSQ